MFRMPPFPLVNVPRPLTVVMIIDESSAYEQVRDDKSEINWLLIDYEVRIHVATAVSSPGKRLAGSRTESNCQ